MSVCGWRLGARAMSTDLPYQYFDMRIYTDAHRRLGSANGANPARASITHEPSARCLKATRETQERDI